MTLTTRIATSDDVPCLVDAFQGFAALFLGARRPDGELARDIERLIGDQDTDFFVAYDGEGRCAGFLQQRYRYSLWLGAEEANIEDVFVPASMRGRGLGRSFMEAALERAVQRGCKRATLDVIDNNVVPLDLFGRMGFTAVRERQVTENDPITRGRQLYMVKSLP